VFSRFFIHRPVFASVISIVIVILGLVAAFQLPVEQYPDLAPPVVRVEAQYPGASAQVVADTVASVIEQEVNGVGGMIYMSSTSTNGGYGLDVSFEVGTDVDQAAVLVQNRVNQALPRLPEDVRRLGVSTRKQSSAIVGVVAIYPESPAFERQYDDLYLANYMSLNIRDEMLRLEGVGGVSIFPAKDYAMRVWLDMAKLKARGITVTDVNQAISEQNVQVAAGTVGTQPAPPDTQFELIVTTKGRLSDPAEFGRVIVKREAGQRVVYLSDVANIVRESRDYSTLCRFNGKPASVMPIFQLPGGNLVQIAEDMDSLFSRLRADPAWPSGMAGTFFYDASMFIRASLTEVIKTLVEAFVLVFLVVLIFLQSFRATIIPTLTIPVALIGTFLFMALFGFTVNMLTMFGLILAIGIVVDDAIVVVENVERNLSLGITDVKKATEQSMTEITGPVIAITLVLMSVFLPTAAQPGITGSMYRQFALTIAASTFLSAVNALTLSPALCGLLLRAHDPHHQPGPIARVLGWPGRAFNAVFGLITRAYGRLTALSIRVWFITFIALGAVFFGTYIAYTRVPTGFVPDEDLGFVVVAAQLQDSASLSRSDAVIRQIADIVGGVDGVANVVTLTGFSLLDGQGSNYANAWVVLKDWDERAKKGRSVQAITGEIQGKIAAIREADCFVFSLPSIRGLGNASGFEMRLIATDRARISRDDIQAAAQRVIGNSFGRGLVSFSSFRAGVPQLFVDIDRDKALKMNIPLRVIFQTLQTALGSAYVNDFNLFGRTYQVTSQAMSQYRQTAEDIGKLEVRTADGRMVPLGSLAQVRDAIGPDRVVRFNLYESATINGFAPRGISSGQALVSMEQIAATELPPGIGYRWSAMSYQERRVGAQGLIIFAIAILLVYLILAAQYESWTTPLAVVLSIPLVIVGAMLLIGWRQLDNNVFTQVGLVLLVGLGAKNAILIVEFARQNRMQGKGLLDSAVEAATTRFRPILMTSLAFVLGVLPLVIATGAGAASRQALGTAVFGGMTGTTVLGLIFTPALWVGVQWASERVGLAKKPGATPPPALAPHH
jgi:HAE1 family hydrophobic/amphiphilic exporter-1